MSRLFYQVMQDNVGNLLFDVSGTMRIAGSGTLATIYGDEALTVILPNPMTNHPSFGSFKCFLGPGDYDFYMAKAGYTFETLTGLQGGGTMVEQDASAVAITGGSVTGLTALSSESVYAEDFLQVGNNLLLVDVATRKLAILTALSTYDLDINATVGGMHVTGPLGLGTVPDAAFPLKVGGDAWFAGKVGVKIAPTYDFQVNAAAGGMRVDGPLALGAVPNAAYALQSAGPLYLMQAVGIRKAPDTNVGLGIAHDKATQFGLVVTATGTDSGQAAVVFQNVAGGTVGSISTTGVATAYNTASDARLKDAITALPDALATLQRLLPVQFRWKATGEVGHGFVAQDVQPVVPQAVSGDPADPAPTMQMDLSKLVPHLVGAVKELAQQVQVLSARLAAVEGA